MGLNRSCVTCNSLLTRHKSLSVRSGHPLNKSDNLHDRDREVTMNCKWGAGGFNGGVRWGLMALVPITPLVPMPVCLLYKHYWDTTKWSL